MSKFVKYDWDEKKFNDFIRRVESTINPVQIDRVLAGTAQKGRKELIEATPKDKGETARSWQVVRKGFQEHGIITTNKVVGFLDEGTKAHGPRVKKYLYIPLRPGARVWRRGLVINRDYILTKWVRGIKARGFFEPTAEKIQGIMLDDFTNQLEKIDK